MYSPQLAACCRSTALLPQYSAACCGDFLSTLVSGLQAFGHSGLRSWKPGWCAPDCGKTAAAIVSGFKLIRAGGVAFAPPICSVVRCPPPRQHRARSNPVCFRVPADQRPAAVVRKRFRHAAIQTGWVRAGLGYEADDPAAGDQDDHRGWHRRDDGTYPSAQQSGY